MAFETCQRHVPTSCTLCLSEILPVADIFLISSLNHFVKYRIFIISHLDAYYLKMGYAMTKSGKRIKKPRAMSPWLRLFIRLLFWRI